MDSDESKHYSHRLEYRKNNQTTCVDLAFDISISDGTVLKK
jgi:hypothetical protein